MRIEDGRVAAPPGSSSLRSPEPLRVSASGDDPSRKKNVCACGRPKHRELARCRDCRWPPWSAGEDATLRDLHSQGVPFAQISGQLGRSQGSVRGRAKKLGLSRSWADHQHNRIAAVKAFFADPEKAREWCNRPISQETRAKIAASLAARNRAGTMGVKGVGHSAVTRQKMAAAQRRRADARLTFAPRGHPLRELYHELVHRKHFSGKEAIEIVRGELDRMTPFERQMLRVAAGAGVSIKIAPPRQSCGQTLGGVAEYG